MKNNRQVVAYKRYFLDFYEGQSAFVQKKIEWTLKLLIEIDQVPDKYFKHITNTNGLFEIRVEAEGNIFRIFSFFDKGSIIVLGNAFVKKTQKTPKNEIIKALKIMEDYYNEKKKNNIIRRNSQQ